MAMMTPLDEQLDEYGNPIAPTGLISTPTATPVAPTATNVAPTATPTAPTATQTATAPQQVDSPWSIDYNQFEAAMKPFGGVSTNWHDTGQGSPELSLASNPFGKTGTAWNPTGSGGSIQFIPKGTKTLISAGYAGGSGGDAVDPVYSEPTTEDQWTISGDMSALQNAQGTNQHTDVTYHKVGDKLVPVSDPTNWNWSSPYSMAPMAALTFASMIAAPYLLPEISSALGGATAAGVGSTTAETISLMEANGLTAAEIAAATGGNVAGYTAAEVAAMEAATGAAGATATDTFLSGAEAFKNAEFTNMNATNAAFDASVADGSVTLPNAFDAVTPEVTPTPAPEAPVAPDAPITPEAPVTPNTPVPEAPVPEAAPPTPATPPTAPPTPELPPPTPGIPATPQEIFRASEIIDQNGGKGAYSIISKLADKAIEVGSTVADWIKVNPTAATILFSSVSSMVSSKNARDAASILAQNQIDQINLKEQQKITENNKNSSAIVGLRKPGLIQGAQGGLKRNDGSSVFKGNGLINRG